ncbi:MAG: UTP--glucose-1-phosphate uridylyltransferase [Candidatus Latescibacterota bacterium]|nr:MAG: UTP--glucose-1-phosphate uridylyltransferase [Candidatus Latescibacterota bacterium]RKY61788.1 MAG: UTP--glucose-1-phosphate uridylyltransferase [Candidatus Latescibacterota bacterium]RKY66599.1 MAG: UTP--glucose-1-phosphate uridylyltransferase [Candidatus Latescibacterota bacterium]RKY70932.1 MAG: UTP--glucose-1-phosphate uridylyltransferase [Candidatus Latescibacterota bacterium]HDH99489.1 UTP--glucose-1-phosphate uridylyltransferase GalU [Bacillota bacterium]
MRVRKAVIPAAGLGTRFLPATKALPKEMIPIVDKPAIQYIVEEIVASGIEDILIITGRGKRAIEDHFDKSFELNQVLKERERTAMLETLENIEKMADIHYLRQKEALGTGHAILKAKYHIGNEPFAVLFGDDLVVSEEPCLAQLMKLYDKYSASILAVQRVPLQEVSEYGVVKGKPINEVHLVEDLVEKPKPEEAPSNLALLGRYILEPDIFDVLERTPYSERGELELTDAIKRMSKDKVVYAYEISGRWYTVGDRLSYLKTTVEFALMREELRGPFWEYLRELTDGGKDVEP